MKLKMLFVYMIFVLSLFYFVGSLDSSSTEIYIVFNPALGTISVDDVRKLYRGEISKVHGKEVVLYEPPLENPVKKLFIEKVLGLDIESYRRIWLVKLMGGSPVPKVMKDEDIIKAVSSQETALGYVKSLNQTEGIKFIVIK